MTKRARWEGPINRDGKYTAVVRDPRPRQGDAVIETNLEGLAAIASALFAIADSVARIAPAVHRVADATCGCTRCAERSHTP